MIRNVLFGIALALPSVAQAGSEELVNCSRYRAKRDGVPVYTEAKTSSRVVAKLKLGETVCSIGEQCLTCDGGPYAIVDWRHQSKLNPAATPSEAEADPSVSAEPTATASGRAEPEPEIVYVRSVDLFAENAVGSKQQKERGIFEQAQEHLGNVSRGIVPDDIYGPFRPFIDTIHPPDKCRAGSTICARVDELIAKPTPSPASP